MGNHASAAATLLLATLLLIVHARSVATRALESWERAPGAQVALGPASCCLMAHRWANRLHLSALLHLDLKPAV